MSTRLHKGGEARYVLQGAQVNDYFLLPAGYRVRNVITENSLLPGQIQNVQTFAFTVTATSAGNLTIDGTTFTGLIANNDTPAQAMAKVVAQGPFIGTTSGVLWNSFTNGTTLWLYSPPSGTYVSRTTAIVASTTATGLLVGTATVVTAGIPSLPGTPNITFGNTIGIKPVQTFTVTAGTTSVGVMTLDGVSIYLGTGLTPAQVASAIASTNLWGAVTTATPWVATASGAQVTLTAVSAKSGVAAVVLSAGTVSGLTFSAVTVVTGGALDTSFYSGAQSVPVAGQSLTDSTANIVAGKGYNPWSAYDKAVFTLTTSSAVAGFFVVNGNIVNLTTAQVATGTTLATALATLINQQRGYFASTNGANILTVYGAPNATGVVFPSLAMTNITGGATGITWTYTQTVHDITYYLNVGATTPQLAPASLGAFNVYVFLEKMF